MIPAFILVGGYGTRIKSTLGDTPKVLADIRGKPFLTILMDSLYKRGIRKFVLCLAHESDKIQAVATEWLWSSTPEGCHLYFDDQAKPAGTIDAIKRACERIDEEFAFVFNGDSFCDVDLAKLSEHRRADVCAVVDKNREAVGAFLINRVKFSSLNPGMHKNLDTEFLKYLGKRASYFTIDAPWWDIGTSEGLWAFWKDGAK